MKHVSIFCLVILSLPIVAGAAGNTVEGLLDLILLLTSRLTEIVFALALLAFFWGLAVFILNAGSSDANARGKNLMFWGIITLFVMASLWGIVLYLQRSAGIQGMNSQPDQPTIRIR